MSPFTRPFRASILACARFIEDLVAERAADGLRPPDHAEELWVAEP